MSFALACALLAACGGGGGRAGVTPPATGNGGAQSSDRRQVDARTAIDHGRKLHGFLAKGRSAAAHTTSGTRRTLSGSGNLVYGSGQLHYMPRVALVFWGFASSANDPNGEATYLTNFANGMGGTWWGATMTQYGNPTFTSWSILNPANYLVGTWTDTTNAVPSSPTSSDIAAEAQRAMLHFGFSEWNLVNYVIATPTGQSTSDFAANGGPYCAWHSTTSYGGGATFPYTNLPYQSDAGTSCGQNSVNAGSSGTLDGVSIVAGHEIAETVTDPDPSSGWVDSTGEEIGDKCAWTGLGNLSTSYGTFAVQPLWSNVASGCTLSYASSAPTKSCTNDAYGYCLQVATSSTHGSVCSDDRHVSESFTTQYLWNNSVYGGKYYRTHFVSLCSDPDEWDPYDPVTQNNDPLLP